MTNASVYWIHSKDCTDIFTQGYVGITTNLKNRLYGHQKRTGNLRLKKAINEYGWNNLIVEVIVISSKEYCLMIEKSLRAFPYIGWNVAEGGGYPPIQYNNQYRKGIAPAIKGTKLSEEAKQRISKMRMGKASRPKGTKLTPEHIAKLKQVVERDKWDCPHCGTKGKGKGAGIRWHFSNCKMNKDKE